MLKLVLFLSVLGQLGCDAAPAPAFSTTSLSKATPSSSTAFFPRFSPSSSSTSSVEPSSSSSVEASSSSSTPSATVGVKAASSSSDADRSKATFSNDDAYPVKATSSFNNTSHLNATRSSSSSSTTKTFIPAPTAMGAGSTSGCYRWHIAQKDDRCMRIESQYNITHAQFLGMNPEINTNCTNLFYGDAYCVLGRFANFTATTRTPETTTAKAQPYYISPYVYTLTTTITSGMTMYSRNSTAIPTGSSKNSDNDSKDSGKISTITVSRTSAAVSSKASSQSSAAVYTVVVVSSKDDMRILSRVSTPTSSAVSSEASTTSSPKVLTTVSTKAPTTLSTSTSRKS